MKYSSILSTGSYLPDTVLTNQQLEVKLDTTDAWIRERTGISERRIACEKDNCTSMAIIAAKRALADTTIKPEDIGLVIVGTSTANQIFPSVACKVQHALQIPDCMAFDVSAACAGFIYALNIADMIIKSKNIKYALIIGADVMSRNIDWNDRSTCVLFGDGAGAVVMAATDKPGLHSTHLHADGQYSEILTATVSSDGLFQPKVHMQGREVFKLAVRKMSLLVNEVLAHNQISHSDIDWLIPHQANMRIIASIAKNLNMPLSRVIQTVNKHANTSAASVPLALDEGVRDGRIKRGDCLLLEAFGSGLAWGAALVTY